MGILEEKLVFEKKHGRLLVCNGFQWQYYRLGHGSPILWLTGGLRRAALGFTFLGRLAENHTVIAPDYPPVRTIEEYIHAFDQILKTEGIDHVILAGQSYGSLLAQAYLALRPQVVETLVISSGGPADYSRTWLAADYLAIGLVRILPEKAVKKMLAGGLLKTLSLPDGKEKEWQAAIQHILTKELTRADVISHFGVAADMIRRRIMQPRVLHDWRGRVIVLSAANDPTQSNQDFDRYNKLFGRPVDQVDLGDMGHAALLVDPEKYCLILEKALKGNV